MSAQAKEPLRQRLLAKRKELSIEVIEQKSTHVFQQFLQNQKQLLSAPEKRIGLYSPIKGEVETKLFLDFFLQNKFAVFFPKIEKSEIHFHQVQSAEQLVPGTFQVLEPVGAVESAQIPETIFIPGLGFDQLTGARLGFGKGYYDRFFTKLNNVTIRKIGLSYDFQVIASFQSFPTDVCMDFVLTESRAIKF